jgi:hypothetical protein
MRLTPAFVPLLATIGVAVACAGESRTPTVPGTTEVSPSCCSSGPDSAPLPDAATMPIDASGPIFQDAADASVDATVDTSAPLKCPVCKANWNDRGALPSGLNETSGLAASRDNPGRLYAHNDSGDTARIFLITEKGAKTSEIKVKGAEAIDWEDMAVGPCSEQPGAPSCVYVGDIGDNEAKRSHVTVYRFREPRVGDVEVQAEAFRLEYPDSAHDAESLMIDDTGRVYLLTKVKSGVSKLFGFALKPGVTSVGSEEGTYKPGFLDRVTGADYRGGSCPRMVIRSYGAVMMFEGAPGEGPAALLKRVPRSLGAPEELQGESIAFSRDGLSLFSASEGDGAMLHELACSP